MVLFSSMRWFAVIVLFNHLGLSLALGQVSTGPNLVESMEAAELNTKNLNYQNPYLQHAPLAAFSIGSLAIGTLFYALENSLHEPKAGFIPEDRTSLGSAVGAAGITALIAGVAYFYYSNRDIERERAWETQISGSLESTGEMNSAVTLVLPLSLLKF